MQTQSSFLQVKNIYKSYHQTIVLNDISFDIEQHKNVAIVGISGSGKTSLLKILSGYLQTTAGEVVFEGNRILGPFEKLLPGHKGIAYLSQHYELHNNYVVKDLVLFENKFTSEKAEEIFSLCQVNHLLNRKTNELSGGEKQRIALCKLLITQPKLLVLDEPFSNLDLVHIQILKTVLKELQKELGITILLASHNPLDTLNWADEIIVMNEGKILQHGNAETIFFKPINEYVAGLFGSYTNLKTLLNTKEFCIARPNQIYFSSNLNSELIGTIKSINFMGNYYEVETAINNQICYVHLITKPIFSIKDVVGITINTNSPCC